MQIQLGDKNRLFTRDDGRLDFEGNTTKAADVFIREHVLPAANGILSVPDERVEPSTPTETDPNADQADDWHKEVDC